MSRVRSQTVSDVNLIGSFLADCHPSQDLRKREVDTVVICASAVLYGAEVIFRGLQNGALSAKKLVLCGGVGHSTKLIWEAVSNHPQYHSLRDQVEGLPEARVLEVLLNQYFEPDKIKQTGCRVLVEDRSTNCGANAKETRRVLETFANTETQSDPPSSIMIVQDPTMALRTRASFSRTYDNVKSPPALISYPCFIPAVRERVNRNLQQSDTASGMELLESELEYNLQNIPDSQLWDMSRFVELLIGEIPRLRDDENGYGPNGKNFITHVDIPIEVEDAWARLRDIFGTAR